MPIRFAITKASTRGEQLVVDVCQWNPVTGAIVHDSLPELFAVFNDACHMVDVHLREVDMRTLEAYGLQPFCKPETWAKLSDVLDILSGQQDASIVRRRWQSQLEETAMLEENRANGAESTRTPLYGDEDYSYVDDLTKRRQEVDALGCTCSHKLQYECPLHGSAAQASLGLDT